MEVEYNISEDDYVKSAKLGAAATRKQFVWLGIIGFALLVLGLFGPDSMKIIGYLGFVGGILGYFVTVNLICPWQAKKNYRNYKTIQQRLKLELTEGGFTIRAESGLSDVKWEHLLKWRENKDIILVFFAPKMYYLVPKRVSDAGFDVEVFRHLLREKLGPQT